MCGRDLVMFGIPKEKIEQQEKLRQDIEKYLAEGGKITVVEPTVSGQKKDPRFEKARERDRRRDSKSRVSKSK